MLLDYRLGTSLVKWHDCPKATQLVNSRTETWTRISGSKSIFPIFLSQLAWKWRTVTVSFLKIVFKWPLVDIYKFYNFRLQKSYSCLEKIQLKKNPHLFSLNYIFKLQLEEFQIDGYGTKLWTGLKLWHLSFWDYFPHLASPFKQLDKFSSW